MNNEKVLIITYSSDNASIDLVMEDIKKAGAQAIRFDVDKYPVDTTLTTLFSNGKWTITLKKGNNELAALQDVTAMWFRRSYDLGLGLREQLERKYYAPSMAEVQRTLYGMMEGLNCYHLGRHTDYRRMDSKEEQLKIANSLGLLIPHTCITNDPGQAKAFIMNCKNGAILKMQAGFSIYEGDEEHVVFTNTVDESQLADIATLQYCPMQFQEKIEKALELRVTIVGDKIFSFEIDSQKLETAKTDWRKEGVKLLDDWKPHPLPEEINTKLLRLMDVYSVDYGAIDLILTPEGKYYFLEINAAGEYFWLDMLCDNAISHQIAAVLTNTAPRRGAPSTF